MRMPARKKLKVFTLYGSVAFLELLEVIGPMAEWCMMDDGLRNILLFGGYIGCGVAIGVGGWKHWGGFGRTVFFLIWPLRGIVGALLKDVWPYISPEGDRKEPDSS
jgi:hypothetical protein